MNIKKNVIQDHRDYYLKTANDHQVAAMLVIAERIESLTTLIKIFVDNQLNKY